MQDTTHTAGTSAAHRGGPLEDPPEQASPRPRMRASLERGPSRSRGCASLERGRLVRGAVPPRAGSASLEGLSRPRPGSTSLEGAPHACTGPRTRAFNTLTPAGRRHHAPGVRAPHTCASPRTRAFNALTPAGRRHHAPRVRAPVLPHQLPRREPIPITVGRNCAAGPVPVP
jgi:hypothetical protein